VYRALLRVYRALLRVYRALLRVYRALLRVYRALLRVQYIRRGISCELRYVNRSHLRLSQEVYMS